MGQYLDEDPSKDYNDERPHTPPYRARIPMKGKTKNWSLADAGWGDNECLEYFGSQRQRLENLSRIWGLRGFLSHNAWRICRVCREGHCMLLYRLASPVRLKDIMHVFGISRSQIIKSPVL